MRVIVIGNAPTVLLKELGSEIDKFDKVIRMNHYHIEGYEKHVGTKTNIYARSHNPEYPPSDGSKYEEVWLRPEWKMWNVKPWFHVPIINMDESNIIPLTRKNFKNNKTQTTGFRAIMTALKKFGSPVHVLGFNFFNQHGNMGSPCPRPHYYLDEPPNMYQIWKSSTVKAYAHRFDLERTEVQKLIDKKDVIPMFPEEIYDNLDLSHLDSCREYTPDHLKGKAKFGKKNVGKFYDK